jgi:hypothetical protein
MHIWNKKVKIKYLHLLDNNRPAKLGTFIVKSKKKPPQFNEAAFLIHALLDYSAGAGASSADAGASSGAIASSGAVASSVGTTSAGASICVSSTAAGAFFSQALSATAATIATNNTNFFIFVNN